MNSTQHRVGDTVHILPSDSARWAGTYEVTKVNPTTYRLKSPTVAGLKAHHSMVHAGPTPPEPEVTLVPLALNLMPGTPVRFTRGITTDKEQVYVITGNAPRGYRLFPLGGARHYKTNVPASMIEVVTEIDGWRATS